MGGGWLDVAGGDQWAVAVTLVEVRSRAVFRRSSKSPAHLGIVANHNPRACTPLRAAANVQLLEQPATARHSERRVVVVLERQSAQMARSAGDARGTPKRQWAAKHGARLGPHLDGMAYHELAAVAARLDQHAIPARCGAQARQ